jgi:phospholipid transport system transporter-binding protein
MSDAERESGIEFAQDGCARFHGPLTFETVPALFRGLEEQVQREAAVERIDLAGVTAVDSAGLALLLEWQARARANGRSLAVRNVPGALLRLARLCEADELLNLSGRDAAGSATP